MIHNYFPTICAVERMKRMKVIAGCVIRKDNKILMVKEAQKMLNGLK